MKRCEAVRGPLFSLKSAGDAVERFLSHRVVTIWVVFALISMVACLVL